MNSNFNNVYYFYDISIDKDVAFKLYMNNDEEASNKLWNYFKKNPKYDELLYSKNLLERSISINCHPEEIWNNHVSKYYEHLQVIDIQEPSKKRLFVDMDGTLAEWKNIKIEAADYEDIKEIPQKIDEILRTPGYFKNLNPHQNVIDCICQLYKNNDIEIYILSCVLSDKGSSTPYNDKNEWINKYLPQIDMAHRIFVPDGKNKINYVPFGVSENDYLLDDYTKNLNDWSFKGKGIKFLNGINANKGTWDGARINIELPAHELYKRLSNYILHDEFIRDYLPSKRKNELTYKEFRNSKKASEQSKKEAQKEIDLEID